MTSSNEVRGLVRRILLCAPAIAFTINEATAAESSVHAQTRECFFATSTTAYSQRRPHLVISRDLAAYVVLHLRKSCVMIYEASKESAPLAQSKVQLSRIAAQAVEMLEPLYRAQPSLRRKSADDPLYQRLSKAPPKGNRETLSRRTATWLHGKISRLRNATMTSTLEIVEQPGSKESALAATNAVLDIVAEFSFASTITYDAYPIFWQQAHKDAIEAATPRTAESDEVYRKSMPQLGSVKLTDAALALVKEFDSQLRKELPTTRQVVVSIFWAEERRSKNPGDVDWKRFDSGFVLGADLKRRYPPDVVDRVDGIEIVFSAPDPKVLEGKTIDVRNNQLFVRD